MEPSTILCPHCQTVNPARNLYCQACGRPLVQAPQAPASAPTPEELNTNQTVVQKPAEPQPPYPTPAYPPVTQPSPVFGNTPPQQPDYPQGYPQPGVPPQGYPPQGMPPQQPQGYPPQQGFPPQQAYYPPPPPPPAPRPVAAPALEDLGVRVDGWSDLIPGAADQAQAVQDAFADIFTEKGFPGARLEPGGYMRAGVKKPYWVVRTPTESSAVFIEPKGKELFLNWSHYVSRPLDWRKIGILVGIAFLISFLTNLSLIQSFGYFLAGWLFGTFNWLLPVTIIALVAGYIWKGSFWHFFMPEPDEMAKDDRTALMLAVHQSLLAAVDKAGLDAETLRDNVFWVASRDRKI